MNNSSKTGYIGNLILHLNPEGNQTVKVSQKHINNSDNFLLDFKLPLTFVFD